MPKRLTRDSSRLPGRLVPTRAEFGLPGVPAEDRSDLLVV